MWWQIGLWSNAVASFDGGGVRNERSLRLTREVNVRGIVA